MATEANETKMQWKKKRHGRRQMSVKRTDTIQMYCNLDVCGVCV